MQSEDTNSLIESKFFECPLCSRIYTTKSGKNRHFTMSHSLEDRQEVLIELIQDLSEDGVPPSSKRLKEETAPFCFDAFVSAFGSWNEAVEAAGFESRSFNE